MSAKTLYPVNENEVEWTAIRAQGAGGQNVNKVSSAIHLRFAIQASSLPDYVRERLLALNDHRVTSGGIVVIKAQASRSQEQNRIDALARLQAMIDQASHSPIMRRPTRPTLGSKRRRLEAKTGRSDIKRLRAKVI